MQIHLLTNFPLEKYEKKFWNLWMVTVKNPTTFKLSQFFFKRRQMTPRIRIYKLFHEFMQNDTEKMNWSFNFLHLIAHICKPEQVYEKRSVTHVDTSIHFFAFISHELMKHFIYSYSWRHFASFKKKLTQFEGSGILYRNRTIDNWTFRHSFDGSNPVDRTWLTNRLRNPFS